MKSNCIPLVLLGLSLPCFALGHDTWLRTNTAVVRPGDAVYVDLLLGNHGNERRDFKLAGKASLAQSTVEVVAPDGSTRDLKPQFVDRGYTPKEGFWTARLESAAPGLYLVTQTSDQVASFAPERIIRSAKVFFLVSRHLDRVRLNEPGYDRVLGHPLELVPTTNPVAPMGPGTPIQVRLLFRGQPLAGEKISFIPMGEILSPGFDTRYERRTDSAGAAAFVPKEADYYLIVAHHILPEKGKGYERTEYAATLTVLVPAVPVGRGQ